MEVDDYCVICQEYHQMTSSCMQSVECRNCNRKGHLRLHCPQDAPLNYEEDEHKQTMTVQTPENMISGIKRKIDDGVDAHESNVKLSKTQSTHEHEGHEHSTPDDSVVNIESVDDLKKEYFEQVHVKEEYKVEDCKEEYVKAEDVQEDNVNEEIAKEVEGSNERISLWTPQFTKIWQVRYENKTAVCPSDECDCMIKFEKMEDHLNRSHHNLEKHNILCNLCKKICLPESLSYHMPNCMITTPLGHLLLEYMVTDKYPQPSLDSNRQFWKTEKNGTIYCPNENCKFKSATISKKKAKKKGTICSHINKHHPVLNTNNNIHCKFCKSIVSPSHIRSHLGHCSAAKPVLGLLPRTTSGLKENFQDVSLLPGLQPVQIDSDGLDFFSAKLFLEAHLVRNFMKSQGSNVRCTWMYMNYMETNKVRGRKMILFPTRFLLVIKELSSDRWKMEVGPFWDKEGPQFENLYFKGLGTVIGN